MQLNISTDYAIRAMLFLAQAQVRTNAAEISESMCIPLNTCKRNLQLLKNAGLVTPYPGVSGGYSLSRDASSISLGDIFNAVGEKFILNRCLESDQLCNRNAVVNCPVHKVYSLAQASLSNVYNTTLGDLLKQ